MTGHEEKLLTVLEENREVVLRSESWYNELLGVITDLVNNDFTGLIHILYRIDVSEIRLKELLNSSPTEDAAHIISRLIVERQLQKIRSRQLFGVNANEIADEDRW